MAGEFGSKEKEFFAQGDAMKGEAEREPARKKVSEMWLTEVGAAADAAIPEVGPLKASALDAMSEAQQDITKGVIDKAGVGADEVALQGELRKVLDKRIGEFVANVQEADAAKEEPMRKAA